MNARVEIVDDDEYVRILVDGEEVISANHDEHGWAGMDIARETARSVAKALGTSVS